LKVDLQDKELKTAMMYACEGKNLSIFNLLLTLNPNLDMADKYGRTSAINATMYNNTDMLK